MTKRNKVRVESAMGAYHLVVEKPFYALTEDAQKAWIRGIESTLRKTEKVQEETREA